MAFYRCTIGDSFGPSTSGVQFTNECVVLPHQLRSTDVVKVDFEVDSYIENMVVLGNTNAFYQQFFLSAYVNKFLTTDSNGFMTIYMGNFASGRHTFEWNVDGHIKFDGDFIVDGQGNPITISPADFDCTYTIGYRGAKEFTGRIHSLSITNGSTDELICDLRAYGKNGAANCLYDVVNDKIYAPQLRNNS